MGTIVNHQTEREIEMLVTKLPQSVLLIGHEGQGTLDIAKDIADQVAADFVIILPEKNEKIDIDSGVIGVKQIRSLYDASRVKRTKKHITIIPYGDRMTHQAQNAFLKLLEEPNENNHFIIITSSTENMLDTVLSRLSRLVVRPLTDSQSLNLVKELAPKDEQKQIQLQYIAAGMPVELKKLANDSAYFEERSENIRLAMEVLGKDNYSKVKIIHSLKDDRVGAIRLVNDIVTILSRLIFDKPSADLITKLESASKALSSLEQNGNIRLVLTKAFV